MENMTGTWEEEYSINIGKDEDPKIEYHSFKLELHDQNGELSGIAHDVTLSNESSKISGFRENHFISFIKRYERLIFQESGKYFGEDSAEHPDIHYSGIYITEKNCFQGTWEIHEDEKREGLQESFEDRFYVGNWYMRKIGQP